jgi:hypothetical protein
MIVFRKFMIHRWGTLLSASFARASCLRAVSGQREGISHTIRDENLLFRKSNHGTVLRQLSDSLDVPR